MLYSFKVKEEKDKIFVGSIIEEFLNEKSYEEIAKEKEQSIEFIKWLLNYKKMITENFGENVWESVQKRVKVISNQEQEERKAKEYEQIMNNLIFYLLNSLYTYNEIAEITYISKNRIQSMVLDNDYITTKYGEQTAKKVQEAIELRKKCYSKKFADNVIVKAPKHRRLIRPEVVSLPKNQFLVLEKVALFFEYSGDTQKMAMESEYLLNNIVTSLNSNFLKDIMLESMYEQFQKLLEIDRILTQNSLEERKLLIQKTVATVYYEKGNMENIINILGYPTMTIERILKHPYTLVVCNELGINKECIELKDNDELIEEPAEKINRIEK